MRTPWPEALLGSCWAGVRSVAKHQVDRDALLTVPGPARSAQAFSLRSDLISEVTVHNWVMRADVADGLAVAAPASGESGELREARKRDRLLEQEAEVIHPSPDSPTRCISAVLTSSEGTEFCVVAQPASVNSVSLSRCRSSRSICARPAYKFFGGDVEFEGASSSYQCQSSVGDTDPMEVGVVLRHVQHEKSVSDGSSGARRGGSGRGAAADPDRQSHNALDPPVEQGYLPGFVTVARIGSEVATVCGGLRDVKARLPIRVDSVIQTVSCPSRLRLRWVGDGVFGLDDGGRVRKAPSPQVRDAVRAIRCSGAKKSTCSSKRGPTATKAPPIKIHPAGEAKSPFRARGIGLNLLSPSPTRASGKS